jgi:hypothetical protein
MKRILPQLAKSLFKTTQVKRADLIISIAKQYIGKKEKPGNAGFFDAAFQKLLVAVGWLVGQAWCAYFVKMVYVQAYANSPKLLSVIKRMSNGGALMTLNNHKVNGTFKVGDTPKPGAIVIWKHGKGPQGHAGIVETVNLKTNTMTCIEGNTNASGSREGDCVADKFRTITRDFKAEGLNIAGYIYPVED